MSTETKTGTNNECILVPVTDIFETENDYSLILEMPGVTKDNLVITLDDNELEIKGKVTQDETDGKELKYSENTLYDYYRKFKTGTDIDRDAINATLKDGILKLVLSKSEEVKPKKIEVNISK